MQPLYEVILENGEWFAIGTADEIAELEAEARVDPTVIPMAYTVREYGA